MKQHFQFLLLLCLSCFGTQLIAQEKIIYFHSDIQILENGGLDVTETIKVKAEGDQIKRGIFRVLPTSYEGKFGLKFKVNYDFLNVLRDGSREDYHTESTNTEVKLYIGSSSVFLNTGEYVYTIRFYE